MTLGNILPDVEGADPKLLAETLGPDCLEREVDVSLLEAVRQAIIDLRKWSKDVEGGVLTDNEQKAEGLKNVTKSLRDALGLRQENEGAPVDDAQLSRALKNVARALQKELAAF